jgi:predicted MFS family arabinose efflux permease
MNEAAETKSSNLSAVTSTTKAHNTGSYQNGSPGPQSAQDVPDAYFEPSSTPPPPSFRSVLGQPAVRALWVATLISYIGDTFGAMALFIMVNRVTHSTVALATVGLVETLPLFLGLVAGVLVDRWRYRPVLMAADLVRAALLPLYLLFRSSDDLWLVLAVTLSISVASRFFFPASGALRRALLRPEEYSVAASLWQMTMGLSFVVGPALAGLVISAFSTDIEAGIATAFIIDSLSFVASATLIFVLVRSQAQAIDAARQREERPHVWADLRDGLRVMLNSKPLRGVAVLYGVGLLGVGAVFVLVVPYVQTLFNGGPREIGLLDAIQAFGLAVGAIAVGTVLSRKLSSGQMMLLASVLGGASVVGLGLAPVYGAALIAMCFAGVAAGAVQSAGAVVMLHEIPQRHQGKGNATLNTLLNISYVTSIALSGVSGQLLGIRNTFIIGGVLALLGVLLAVPFLNQRQDVSSSSGNSDNEPSSKQREMSSSS